MNDLLNLPLSPTNVVAAFDYSVLDNETAQIARDVADAIRQRNRRGNALAIEIGNDLLGVKERLGHGNFGKWLKAEFDWSERTAQRFMQAAEAFKGKSDTVAVLPAATMYRLSAPSTPVEIRERVISDLEAGKPIDPQKVQNAIARATEPTTAEKTAKFERHKIARRRKLTPEDENRIARKQRKQEAEDAKRERELDSSVAEAQAILAELPREKARRLLELLDSHLLVWRLREVGMAAEPATPSADFEPERDVPGFLRDK